MIGGTEFEIQPLTVENFPLILKLSNKDTRDAALQEVLVISLKQSIPDATEEEIKKVSVSNATKWLEAILDVNGLGDEGKKQAALQEVA